MTTNTTGGATANASDKTLVIPFGTAPKSETIRDFHDGTVVSISGDRLVVASNEGRKYSFRVAPDAFICCDGVTCLAEDLKVGSKIRLTPKADDKNVAVKIESLINQIDFADID